MFQVFSGVLYVCLQVFHPDIAYVCNGFRMFFRRFCKCFICLFLYIATVASECFKSISMLHMECAWEAADGADDIPGGMGDV
jgi:hypothetical protein